MFSIMAKSDTPASNATVSSGISIIFCLIPFRGQTIVSSCMCSIRSLTWVHWSHLCGWTLLCALCFRCARYLSFFQSVKDKPFRTPRRFFGDIVNGRECVLLATAILLRLSDGGTGNMFNGLSFSMSANMFSRCFFSAPSSFPSFPVSSETGSVCL